jgi:hypothetical protein
MGLIISHDSKFNDIKLEDINLEENNIIPNDFKLKVLQEFILPYYRSNIEYVINEKTIWSRMGTGFLTTSTILIGAASILSFASSTYPERNLNFVAGSVGMVALVLKEFASYANSVDHIKTLTLNDLLKNIGLKHTINDTSKNFKKVMQDNKIDTQSPTVPSPIPPELEKKMEKTVNKQLLDKKNFKLEELKELNNLISGENDENINNIDNSSIV